MEGNKRAGRALLVGFLFVIAIIVPCVPTNASPVILSGVPAYINYHGCGPTALGMDLNFWAGLGYSNLSSVQGNALYLTSNVQDEISSPAHNAKYDPTPDDPNLPTPPFTSIADWLGTSKNPLAFGESTIPNVKNAIIGYAAYKGYTFQAYDVRFNNTWATLVSEVNSGRPMIFYVDYNGSGTINHDIPVFGYDDRGADGKWFACYTTWSEDEIPVWYEYKPYATGTIFGVYGSTQVIPPPIPEPATIGFLLAGALLLRRHKKT